MIEIYPENLKEQLQDTQKNCYLIFGKDEFLLQKSINDIKKVINTKKNFEYFFYKISSYTNLDEINCFIQSTNLFLEKKILFLKVSEKITQEKILEKKTIKLINLLYPKLFIVMFGKILTQKQKIFLYKNIKTNPIYVNCSILKKNRLLEWITHKTKKFNINLSAKSTEFLSLFYQDNLLTLNQIFNHLSLSYQKKKYSLIKIEKIIYYIVDFTYHHLINMLLIGNLKHGLKILKKLQKKNYEISTTIYHIQEKLLLLLKLKNKNFKKNKIQIKLLQYQTQETNHFLINLALKRLSTKTLEFSIHLISESEFYLKKNFIHKAWEKLELLTISICNNTPFTQLFYEYKF